MLGETYAQFNLFIPANATQGPVPLLTYLAGLTCTEDNGYGDDAVDDFDTFCSANFLVVPRRAGL